MSKKIALLTFGWLLAQSTLAEPIRPTFTRENRLPGRGQVETTVAYRYAELNEEDYFGGAEWHWVTASARYGAAQDAALEFAVPYGMFDGANSDEQGLGDVRLGAEARVFEMIYGYPFVLPHVALVLPSGDEDKGLGTGETVIEVGATIGTTVDPFFRLEAPVHFNLDGTYRVIPNADNEFLLGISAIWDLSDRFSILGECRFSDGGEERISRKDSRFYVQFGASYDVSRNLTVTALGGGAQRAEEDTILSIKTSYTF